MWTFRQTTGQIQDFTGRGCGVAYAGRGEGLNNPILQDVRAGCRLIDGEWTPVEGLTGDDWGPPPCGIYTMLAPEDTETHGPYVIWLVPGEGNEMFGRSGFGLHGDEIANVGKFLASEGCIVYPQPGRKAMWESNDHRIQVIQ